MSETAPAYSWATPLPQSPYGTNTIGLGEHVHGHEILQHLSKIIFLEALLPIARLAGVFLEQLLGQVWFVGCGCGVADPCGVEAKIPEPTAPLTEGCEPARLQHHMLPCRHDSPIDQSMLYLPGALYSLCCSFCPKKGVESPGSNRHAHSTIISPRKEPLAPGVAVIHCQGAGTGRACLARQKSRWALCSALCFDGMQVCMQSSTTTNFVVVLSAKTRRP